MHIRKSKVGKREYLRVFESYRDKNGKPTSRAVCNIGRVDKITDKDLRSLVRGLNKQLGQVELPVASYEDITPQPSRTFGDVFALHALWMELGFDKVIGRGVRGSKGAGRQ